MRREEWDLPKLLELAATELKSSIERPNIFNFQEKPYPEQDRFFRSQKPGRYIAGSNRGGKTDAAVIDATLHAMNEHPFRVRPKEWGDGPIQIRFLVVDVEKGIKQIMVPKFQRWVPSSALKGGTWNRAWDSNANVLTFENGSTIDFVTWGMENDKLGGVPRHMIYFDEEPPNDKFNELMMRLIDYHGHWVIAATPVQGMSWTYDYLWEPAKENPDGEVDTFTLRMEDNPYLQTPKEDRDFYMMGMSREERMIREEGSFVAKTGLVFPNFSIDTHVLEEPIMPPKSWAWYTSTDHGWNNPTAWLWHAVAPNGRILTFAEHYESRMTVAEHAAIVLAREASWGKEPEIRTGDPAMGQHNGVTGTTILQAYGESGVHIGVEGVPKEPTIGIEKMQAYFKLRPDSPWGENRPYWMISPNCVNLIRELKKLRWKAYESEKKAYDSNKQEEVHKRNDHAFDSAKYFATLMPDLRPDLSGMERPDPVTLGYADFMAKLMDDGVELAQDVAGEPRWQREVYEAPDVLTEELAEW
jgi:phage terminase large subunit-like protein